MDKNELKNRTKEFALRVIKMSDSLPKTTAARVVTNQIIRSATSVGANYRAACRGRSKAEFIAKIGTVLEETDECVYWLEIISESGMLSKNKLTQLLKEADELAAIFYTIIKSSKNAK